MERADHAADARCGVTLVQAANNTLANSISDATALNAALAKCTPLKTQFPATALGAQMQQVAQIIQVPGYLGMTPADFLLLPRRFRYSCRRARGSQPALSAIEPRNRRVLCRHAGIGCRAERHHLHGIRFQPDLPTHHHRRQRSRLGQSSPGAGRGGQGGQIYGVPGLPTWRPERHRYAWTVDSYHIHRPVRRHAVFLVRHSRYRAEDGISQLRELRIGQDRLFRPAARVLGGVDAHVRGRPPGRPLPPADQVYREESPDRTQSLKPEPAHTLLI